MKKANKSGQDGNHDGEKSKSAKLPKAAAPEVVLHPVEEALLRYIGASAPLGLPAYLLLSLAQTAGMHELTGDGLMEILESLKGYGKIGEARHRWHLASAMPAPKPGEMPPEFWAVSDALDALEGGVSRVEALLYIMPEELWDAVNAHGETAKIEKKKAEGLGFLAQGAAEILRLQLDQATAAVNGLRKIVAGQGQGS